MVAAAALHMAMTIRILFVGSLSSRASSISNQISNNLFSAFATTGSGGSLASFSSIQ
jgi:hypothetical protein